MAKRDWWTSTLSLVVGEIGISPKDFWRLSLPELQAIISPYIDCQNSDKPSREYLDEMIKNHPDAE